MSKALLIGVTALVLSVANASAQVYLTPDYGYGYAAPVADLAAPAYGYAAPTYVAPAPVYTASPVYAAPVYAGPPVYAVPAPRYGTMPPHMATRPAAVNGLLKEVGSDSEARGFGGFNDHLKKPDGGQCAACGRSFIGGGTEQPGGQPPEASGTASNPAAPGSAAAIRARTARHHGTRHHRVYMMSVNCTHKGSKLTPANNAKLQMKQ